MAAKAVVFCLLVTIGFFRSASDPVPLVMWHGMGDTCCYPFSMGNIKNQVEKAVPGIYVHSLEIGDNIEADEINGFLMNADDQMDYVCKKVKSDPKLSRGFNSIGFSQGGQFLRGLVERCAGINMINLISVGGQHQGVFGFPKCIGANHTLCDIMRKLLNLGAYNSIVQKHLVQADYWHDPLNEAEYKAKCTFLPDINQENKINQDYKNRLSNLSNFVMVMFSKDTMVQPKESEWFGFFKPGQDKEVQYLKDTPLYQEDKLGLKYLDQNKRLHFLQLPYDHLQMPEQWFMDNLVHPFINVNFTNQY